MRVEHSLSVLATAFCIQLVNADIINVPADHPTIQAAIDAASDGDEVVVHPGTYFERVVIDDRAIVLRSVDPLDPVIVQSTQIDGSRDLGPLLRIQNVDDDSVSVRGLTVMNGDSPAAAALLVQDAAPLIQYCVFHQNRTQAFGSTISMTSSQPRIDSCRFLGNTGESGAIFASASLSQVLFSNCVFSGNAIGAGSRWSQSETSLIEFVNCSFHANQYETLRIGNGATSFFNCVTDEPSGGTSNDQGIGEIRFCCNFTHGSDPTNFVATPYFRRPNGVDGIAGTFDDDLSLHRFSPCTDRGDNGVAEERAIVLDGLGLNRFVDDGNVADLGEDAPVIDLGAFERQVDSVNLTFSVTPSDNIAEVIPHTAPGDTIELQPGRYLQAIDPLGRPICFRSVDPDDADIVASTLLEEPLEGGPQIRCSMFETTDTIFDGLTIGENDSGASVWTFESGLTLRRCIVRDNLSDAPAVMCTCKSFDRSVVMLSCRFLNNMSTWGGGAIDLDSCSVTIVNCEFIGNSSEESAGAASLFRAVDPIIVLNSTFTANSSAADLGGAVTLPPISTSSISNSIFFDNEPTAISPSGDQINVAHSLVDGGYPGIGNIDADPLFLDADGPDNILGTLDDNTRLSPGSPAIDAASNTAYEGTELFDLDGNPRFINDACTDDTGEGQRPIIDMGAYEFQPCIADINCDDTVTVDDLLLLLSSWGACVEDCPADINNDTTVDTNDLLQLLAHWNDC